MGVSTLTGNVNVNSPSLVLPQPANGVVMPPSHVNHGNMQQENVNIIGEGTPPSLTMNKQQMEAAQDINRISDKSNDFVTSISNFVEQIRIKQSNLQKDQTNAGVKGETGGVDLDAVHKVRSTVRSAPGYEDTHQPMENVVVEAEKFKAAIERPPGREFSFNSLHNISLQQRHSIGEEGSGVTDDDFFHMTCHISPNLKEKIQAGEYVDLDKLLPKVNIFHSRHTASHETKLEWVQSEGTYLVPTKNVSHINCFIRWKQAFRVYATIYCTKNPERSREVWQYVSVINSASMSYNWDNVYNYDMVFRQLMEFNPKRSWAVTYNQMWNLSMTNPISRNPAQNHGFRKFNNSGYNGNNNNSQPIRKKLDYCWSFNKGIKCKFGKKCKFIERCSYCDAASHGVVNCDKLDKREKDSYVKGNGGRKKSH